MYRLSKRDVELITGQLYARMATKVPELEYEKFRIKFAEAENKLIMDLSALSTELKLKIMAAGYAG